MASGVQPKMFSTVRGYQMALRMFCDYLVDDRYGWIALCANRFGAIPTQVLHEWNSVSHVSEFEGRPGRRALTYDEVQGLFDAADGQSITAFTVTPGASRNTAMITLAADLPAAVLADLLGLHPVTAVRWARAAKRDWHSYLAERRTDAGQGGFPG
ncbi:hypothetical protein [Nocardia albiluteola]|uniref:hypothetical protein n=1 Tax=Nocardia albiluteola TaxID=2842303 RepID=UPI001FD95738|nr:hypothetical protein [Nocardia albiluteola]